MRECLCLRDVYFCSACDSPATESASYRSGSEALRTSTCAAAIARIAGNMSRASTSRFVLLQALALQDNVIESLPMAFVNLSNLTTLDLGGNKMQGIPVNVLQGGPQAVLQFMRYNCRYDS
jgi:hypothetical protein